MCLSRDYHPVHTNLFLFENGDFSLWFTYRPPFFGKTATENTSFKWRTLKTLASRLRVDGRKQRVSNTMMSFIALRMLRKGYYCI